jgi:hypothetical protein
MHTQSGGVRSVAWEPQACVSKKDFYVKTHLWIGQAALNEFEVKRGDLFVERLVQVAALQLQAAEKQEATLPGLTPKIIKQLIRHGS